MTTRVPLAESGNVILDGSGNGTAKVGPLSSREVWYPGNVHVSANSNPTNQATCRIYVGTDTTQNNFRDETPYGSSGDSSGTVGQDTLKCGQWIWAIWTGGDAGANAVVTVTGYKDV